MTGVFLKKLILVEVLLSIQPARGGIGGEGRGGGSLLA